MKNDIIVILVLKVISLIILISFIFFMLIHIYNIKTSMNSTNIDISTKTYEDQEMIMKGNFGKINRIFKEGSITNTGASILLINRTNIKIFYSYWFVIEKKVNNEWKLLKTKRDIVIDALARYISPNECIEINLDWSKAYGTLKKGEYRLVLEDFSGENTYYYMEFSIK